MPPSNPEYILRMDLDWKPIMGTDRPQVHSENGLSFGGIFGLPLETSLPQIQHPLLPWWSRFEAIGGRFQPHAYWCNLSCQDKSLINGWKWEEWLKKNKHNHVDVFQWPHQGWKNKNIFKEMQVTPWRSEEAPFALSSSSNMPLPDQICDPRSLHSWIHGTSGCFLLGFDHSKFKILIHQQCPNCFMERNNFAALKTKHLSTSS